MDYIEEFIEDNIKIIVITFIVVFVVLALYFIFREKKTYEIVTCQSDGGYFERSFTNKNTNDSCDLAILVENEKISDETKESFTNPYCKIKFNFPCNDVYVKDNHNRIYSKIDNVN